MNRFLKGTFASLTVLAGAAHAAAEGHAAEEGSPLLRFDPGVGIWAIVVFLFLLWILKRFAWGPILDALDAREKSVRESLDQAASIQAENARLADEQSKALAEARAEATASSSPRARRAKRSARASSRPRRTRSAASWRRRRRRSRRRPAPRWPSFARPPRISRSRWPKSWCARISTTRRTARWWIS